MAPLWYCGSEVQGQSKTLDQSGKGLSIFRCDRRRGTLLQSSEVLQMEKVQHNLASGIRGILKRRLMGLWSHPVLAVSISM